MKVLVVDDNAVDRKLMRVRLEAEGQTVVTAGDGVEALALLENEAVDAIISDVLMPRMDGYRFCCEVRRRERLRLLPFIFYSSSYSAPGDQKLAMELGADKFIHKPASSEELVAALLELTTDERYSRQREVGQTQEMEIQKEFSERLVARLELKNQELLERTEQMHAAQERLEHLLEHSPAVLYTLRIKGQGMEPVVVSANIERLLGVSAESTSFEWWRESLHPDDRERALNAIARALSEGSCSTEYRLRHRDGTYRWVQDNNRVVKDASGQPAELVGAWADVTERRHLEAELLHSQKMESLGRLAGGVAHDFNNMLGVMTGYCELLRDWIADEQQRAYLDEILKAGERAAGLTRQLLAFSRRQVLLPRILDLNRVVVDVETMLRRVIGEDIELVSALEERLPAIQADPGQLEQVLLNLAVNARDAMPRGGRLTISTFAVEIGEDAATRPGQRPGRYVELVVADTGEGMSSEVKEHLFEPFFTTKAAGKGTGLGLAMVHGIVEQSGGYVLVDSIVGQGSTFEIYLPIVSAVAPHPTATETPKAPLRGTETVLVVEDEPALRELVRRFLGAGGYGVLEAPGPEEALALCSTHQGPIHLLLTDVVMPGGSGTELASRLVALRPELKVLFMSGYSDEAVTLHGAISEGASLIQKPFTAASLARKVREVLDRVAGLDPRFAS